jgi:3,5-epimerase/4-reductase
MQQCPSWRVTKSTRLICPCAQYAHCAHPSLLLLCLTLPLSLASPLSLRCAAGIEVYNSEVRIENRADVEEELDRIKPSHALMSAGITGRPNIDWCEDHKTETIRTNVIGTLNVADLTLMKDVHCTIYATGCIFKYDDAHPLGSGKGFTEEDVPNFAGSFYSQTKGYMEPMLKCYPNCMILRVRMPVSDDLFHRNFVTKIAKYEKVVNIPNSMTILHEMLPASLAMAQKGLTGVYNFTNPGVISHNQVLDLFKKYIDQTFEYSNFSVEEQAQILKADRSNNELDTTKLMRDMPEGIVINDIQTAFDLCFQRMKVNLEKMGWLPDNLPAEFKGKVNGGTGEPVKKE